MLRAELAGSGIFRKSTMSTEHDEHFPDPGRRRFVLGTLSAGSGALLTAVAGCREAAQPPPTIDSAIAPAPVAP